MDLYFSTSDFQLKGQPYEGFPILCDEHCQVVEPVMDFMIFHCIQRGRVQSVGSWQRYGQDLYDYFSYVEANGYRWDHVDLEEGSLLAAYRDWSLSTASLSPNTVNSRLRTIVTFYQFAARKGMIDVLPFEVEEVYVNAPKGFLAHVDATGNTRKSVDVMLREKPRNVKVLSMKDLQFTISAITNQTHKLMVRFLAGTGVRNRELVSFPAKYIIDPSTHPKERYYVNLDPRDMYTKGQRSRKIEISFGLMADLWDYKLYARQKQLQSNKEGDSPQELFINRFGRAFAQSSLYNALKLIELPFNVYPHIFRHTYATHTLAAHLGDGERSALMFVMKRLGHASINTTMEYLHLLGDIEDDVESRYQTDLDEMGRGVA